MSAVAQRRQHRLEQAEAGAGQGPARPRGARGRLTLLHFHLDLDLSLLMPEGLFATAVALTTPTASAVAQLCEALDAPCVGKRKGPLRANLSS